MALPDLQPQMQDSALTEIEDDICAGGFILNHLNGEDLTKLYNRLLRKVSSLDMQIKDTLTLVLAGGTDYKTSEEYRIIANRDQNQLDFWVNVLEKIADEIDRKS